MHSSVPLPWDGPMRSTFASWKKRWGWANKIGFPDAFQSDTDSGKKTVLSTVSRPREAEEANVR